jgi:HTH-type transcriptional regulator, transcriptional repressor of NAD biosynthesis genes
LERSSNAATDAFATAIWERRYLGSAARTKPTWAQSPALPHHDLYLLTSHESVSWLDDGIREGDLAIRAAMTNWFADALTEAGHPWVMLEGTLTQRLTLALRSIEPVLHRRLTITDPLSGPGFPSSGAR